MRTLRAGYTTETSDEAPLTLRPTVAKTFLKGVIAIGAFSLVLEVGPSNFINYLIFVGLSLAVLVVGLLAKKSSSFRFEDDALVIRRPLRRATSIAYRDIIDLSVSQGMLAKRFNCGTVYVLLKTGSGSLKVMGGGSGEQLEDVRDPDHVYEMVSSRLGFFGGSG